MLPPAATLTMPLWLHQVQEEEKGEGDLEEASRQVNWHSACYDEKPQLQSCSPYKAFLRQI